MNQKRKYYNKDEKRFFPLNPITKCHAKNVNCVGGECGSDQAKYVCGLKALPKEDCIVYSIGSNNEWEFEMDILQSTTCEVHTFDCTGERERFHVPEHSRLHFHYICLTAYSSGKVDDKYWSLLDVQRALGHTRINLLKMDIEGYELDLFTSWPELSNIELSEELLLPHQIVVEVR